MAIYRTGQASMDAQGYITGYDTKWREQLTLIRPGATIVFLTQPLQIAVITEVINDTSIRAITTGGAVVARSNYAILLHDSITVDGLAQDVAETLRYYQSKETEIAEAIEFFRDFDLEGLKDLVNQVKQGAESAKQSASAAKTSETNSKASETNAKASENAANASKNAAKTSETNAANSANKAKTEADRAVAAAGSSEAQNRVPYAGVTVNAASGVRDMLKRLRDTVRGGFWRVNDISQFPAGEMTPFINGSGVCGGAGDTFFAINVDWQTSRVKVFSGNNDGINGYPGSVSSIELAKLGSNGDVAIGDGGTGASNDQGARANLQVMHESQASLNTEDLNILTGDKAGFYYQNLSANATAERNYPTDKAGCLLVQRSGACSSKKSCVQTYTSYDNGRRWIRWLGNGEAGTWSQWYELYNAGSSPTFSGVVAGSSVEARGNEKRAVLRTWHNDVSFSNSSSNKFLQLRDNGELAYDNKLIAYNGLAASGTFAMTVPSIKVTTDNGGFRIDGTASTNNQPLHVTGYNSAGTRLWFLGKDTGASALFLNDITSSKVELITDGVVLGTKNFAGKAYVQAASLEIESPSGKYFKMLNDGSSSHPATFKLWGNASGGRPSIIEWAFDNGPGWGFYCQLNTDNSKLLQVNGLVNATSFNQSSDRDLKDNIEEIENATESLRKMSGYTYTLKENGLPYAGVIAQEVMEAIPEAVGGFTQYTDLAGPTKDGNQLVGEERFLSVDYGAVTGLLVKVCRESDDRISKLEKEVAELKAAVSALINKPTTLES